MLTRLEVKNFALIRDVGLDFSPGLNILTGETGAGKSIVLGALKLLLGERAATDNIRAGCDSSLIQGVFALEEASPVHEELALLGLEEEGEIIISREVNRQGRNLCRLNGLVIPLALVKKIGRHLIDFHGQHEHQSLLDPGQHLRVLDLLCGPETARMKGELKQLFRRFQELSGKIADFTLDDRERARKLDLLTFQLREIEDARLRENEEEELARRLSFLANAEKLAMSSSSAYSELAVSGSRESVQDRLQGIMATLEDISRLDEGVKDYLETLLGAAEIIQDAARELRVYSEGIQADPLEMAEVEKRIAEIENLKKKYGNSIREILAYGEEVAAEKERLEKAEETLDKLARERESLEANLEKICRDLSQRRQAMALKISTAMQEHLGDLAMENAVFKIKFFSREISAQGSDAVEFMFSANAGEPEKPLQKIVSGGELSRVMLALKNIMAEWQWVPTLIFDELDAGIGGMTVQSVGEKVLRLANSHQVVCITHWPQIAALSHRHFRISKEIQENRTVTQVREISGEDRVGEIGRMLGGAEKGSLAHARAILERADSCKIK